jgi:predicted small lipoprotein YifL
MRRTAATAALLLALAACNQRGPDGLTDDERDRLNQIAIEQDGTDVIDASPDSLVVSEDSANQAIANETDAGNAVSNAQ